MTHGDPLAPAPPRCFVLPLAAWEALVAVKEREVSNLQAALGGLTYESEAVERMRLEVGGADPGVATTTTTRPGPSLACSPNGTRGSCWLRGVWGPDGAPRGVDRRCAALGELERGGARGEAFEGVRLGGGWVQTDAAAPVPRVSTSATAHGRVRHSPVGPGGYRVVEAWCVCVRPRRPRALQRPAIAAW